MQFIEDVFMRKTNRKHELPDLIGGEFLKNILWIAGAGLEPT